MPARSFSLIWYGRNRSGGTAAAVDLGATSGRVLLGHVGPRELRLTDVSRFPNRPVRTTDGLHWSILELYRSVVEGLASAARSEPALASIGIDSWGCDYALLSEGRMLGEPYSHRDERTGRPSISSTRRFRPRSSTRAPGCSTFPSTRSSS